MVEKKVFCIVVTFNGMEWIERCISSLVNSSSKSHIIVVDNSSNDGTVSFIKKNYPFLELIESKKNLGFGQGNNIGLAIAINNNAEHIFLLNQDAWVEIDTISKLVKAQKENPEFGIISPVHLNGAGNNFDNYFYKYLVASDIKNLVMSSVLDKLEQHKIINTSFVNAAAWLISSDCLKKTGGFDPIFFHYGEDDNYAQRVLFKGFKIGILTNAKIYHGRKRDGSQISSKISFDLKKDRIIFLNQACDLHQRSYKMLVFRRFLRYSFLMLMNAGLLNKKKVHYNFSMAKHIAFSYKKIKRSRMLSTNEGIPYLDIA